MKIVIHDVVEVIKRLWFIYVFSMCIIRMEVGLKWNIEKSIPDIGEI